jgi:hypothetical protein
MWIEMFMAKLVHIGGVNLMKGVYVQNKDEKRKVSYDMKCHVHRINVNDSVNRAAVEIE